MGLAEHFQCDREAAYLAERDGDYATALRIWQAIEGYIATTPNQERDGDRQEWRGIDIKSHIDRLQRLVSSSGGIETNKITWRNPTLCPR